MERITDNSSLDFPARMSDGRQFTDYRSNCFMNKKSLGMTSQEYKNYMINNGDRIINNEHNILNTLMKCNQCSDYSIVPPYLAVECNKDSCNEFIHNPNGVGIYYHK